MSDYDHYDYARREDERHYRMAETDRHYQRERERERYDAGGKSEPSPPSVWTVLGVSVFAIFSGLCLRGALWAGIYQPAVCPSSPVSGLERTLETVIDVGSLIIAGLGLVAICFVLLLVWASSSLTLGEALSNLSVFAAALAVAVATQPLLTVLRDLLTGCSGVA